MEISVFGMTHSTSWKLLCQTTCHDFWFINKGCRSGACVLGGHPVHKPYFLLQYKTKDPRQKQKLSRFFKVFIQYNQLSVITRHCPVWHQAPHYQGVHNFLNYHGNCHLREGPFPLDWVWDTWPVTWLPLAGRFLEDNASISKTNIKHQSHLFPYPFPLPLSPQRMLLASVKE